MRIAVISRMSGSATARRAEQQSGEFVDVLADDAALVEPHGHGEQQRRGEARGAPAPSR